MSRDDLPREAPQQPKQHLQRAFAPMRRDRRREPNNLSRSFIQNPKEEWALEVTAKLLAPSGQVMLDAMAGGESSKKLPPLTSTTVTPLSQPRGIRVISDLDDTVKRTDLMAGLRGACRRQPMEKQASN